MAARTKRNTRTTRKATAAVGTLDQLRTNALGAVDKIVKQGTVLQAKARKLATAKAKEARAAVMGARDTVTARDVRALSRQVAQLQQSVDQLRRSRARA